MSQERGADAMLVWIVAVWIGFTALELLYAEINRYLREKANAMAVARPELELGPPDVGAVGPRRAAVRHRVSVGPQHLRRPLPEHGPLAWDLLHAAGRVERPDQ